MPIAPKGSIASAISSVVVQLMREHTGRGPTRARTYINEDLITVVLQDTLTMGERSLVRDGEVDLVLASRKAFQRAMSREMIAAVEKHSRRTVLAFLGDNHIEPDVAVESVRAGSQERSRRLLRVRPGCLAHHAVAVLRLGPADRYQLESVGARLEGTHDLRSDTQDVPLAQLANLAVEQHASGA